MFDVGDVVICKRNQHNRLSGRVVMLTRGRGYEVHSVRINEIEVLNDNGEYWWYANHRFKLDDGEPTEEEMREFEKNLREIESSPD